MEKNVNFKNLKKELSALNVEFIDLKTVDLRGKLHSLILPFKMFDDELLKNGVGFDASSYGFAKPENSDMVMIPDLSTMFIDPFRERKTAVFIANIHLTDKERTRFNQDSRFIAQKSEDFLKESEIATHALFGPEFEFFIFKEAEFGVYDNESFYYIEKDTDEQRNFYHSSAPDDEYIDFRNDVVRLIEEIGIDVKYHHHEVSVNQHEIETKFNGLVKTADNTLIIKYLIFNLAKEYDLKVTFMPKPFYGKAGNGFHVHQYLMKNGKNVFYKKGNYANFSELGLSYISGILYHSGSLSSFANPSTNSYKRLVRGFEAPVSAVFAMSNRNAAIRLPGYVKDIETRLEYRAGDSSSNPYLFLSSMLMAGIDGIFKNLKPEKFNFGPFDSDILKSKSIAKKIKLLPDSLDSALKDLKKDNEYLLYSKVFSQEIIDQWIKIKTAEIEEIRNIPHPKEFELYFNF